VPRYTSWVIVIGRQRAGITEHGCGVPEKLTALTEEKLAEDIAKSSAALLGLVGDAGRGPEARPHHSAPGADRAGAARGGAL